MSTDDDSIDSLLLEAYVRGTLATETRAQVENWASNCPERVRMIAQHRQIQAARDAHAHAEPVWDWERVSRNVLPALGLSSSSGVPSTRTTLGKTLDKTLGVIVRHPSMRPWGQQSRSSQWRVALGVCAASLIFVLGIQIAAHREATPVLAQYRTFATARGQRATIQFPDGSSAILGPASRLRYSTAFGQSSRAVELQGAAFFTVTHTAGVPFVVQSSSATAQVLGTSFSVRHYPEDATTAILLAEGRVVVTPLRQPHASVVLSTGDAASIAVDGAMTRSSVGDIGAALAWTQGRIDCVRLPFRVIVAEVARMYDLDLAIASPSLQEQRGTVVIESGTSADQAIEILATAIGARVVRRGPTITFIDR